MGCQFLKGYRQRTAPDTTQGELPIPGQLEELKKINRPIMELPFSEEGNSEILIKTVTGIRNIGNGHDSNHGRTLTPTIQNQKDAPPYPRCGHVASAVARATNV